MAESPDDTSVTLAASSGFPPLCASLPPAYAWPVKKSLGTQLPVGGLFVSPSSTSGSPSSTSGSPSSTSGSPSSTSGSPSSTSPSSTSRSPPWVSSSLMTSAVSLFPLLSPLGSLSSPQPIIGAEARAT